MNGGADFTFVALPIGWVTVNSLRPGEDAVALRLSAGGSVKVLTASGEWLPVGPKNVRLRRPGGAV